MVSGFPSVPVVSHPGHQRLVSSAGAFFSHRSESYFVFAGEAALFHSDADLRVGSACKRILIRGVSLQALAPSNSKKTSVVSGFSRTSEGIVTTRRKPDTRA